jgi:phosphate transport system substrate-binding protein
MLFPFEVKRRDCLVALTAFTVASGVSAFQPQSVTANDSRLLLAQSGGRVSLVGAGASFPAPLYETWFSQYNSSHPNIQISYQSIGSGAGVQQFSRGTVDFGASDVAMSDGEIAQASRGVVMLPMTAGSVVLAYNLPGVGNLKLSRQVYTDIFLGKVRAWNDPSITRINPGVRLPSTGINVVHRSDGSGTTAVFTKHLSAISSQWRSRIGEGKTVQWPVGVGAKGNEGVTGQIQQAQGSIGYIEYGYAKNNNLTTALLQNKAGNFVPPTISNAASALASVRLPGNLRAFVADPPGANSYPIVTYTWILAPKNTGNPAKAKALRDVLNWGLTQGQQGAWKLGYVPLPANVVSRVRSAINTIR